MWDSRLVLTPLPTGALLVKGTESNHGDVDLKLYQGMAGSVMYAML